MLVATLFSPRKNDSRSSSPTAAYSYEIVAEYPHDSNAFCQGLVFHDGLLYESTGEYGESTVRCVDLETGQVKQQFEMPDEYFGEGLAVAEDQLVQLTWKAGLGFTYDLRTLQPTGGFVYEREGWGLTFDGEHFVMSDGSDRLRFLDPESFQVVRTIQVKDQGKRIDDLNELEYIKGEIFANVWYSDFIARISPETGSVLGWIDLRGLLKAPRHEDSVLNGIAYDSENDRLFVTGKNWPALFEIKLKTR
jgi:glutamine cyclotransferase